MEERKEEEAERGDGGVVGEEGGEEKGGAEEKNGVEDAEKVDEMGTKVVGEAVEDRERDHIMTIDNKEINPDLNNTAVKKNTENSVNTKTLKKAETPIKLKKNEKSSDDEFFKKGPIKV